MCHIPGRSLRMEYFTEDGGKYVYRGGSVGLHKRIFSAVLSGSIVFSLGVFIFIYLMLREQSKADSGSFLPYLPLMIFPLNLFILILVRKNLGSSRTVTLNYMNSTLTFYRKTLYSAAKEEISTEDIERIMILRNESSANELSSWVEYIVRITTQGGLYDILTSSDEHKVRGFANEFSSLVSKPLEDLA